ncbi:PepSY-associated TM helix domain-containing protein [Ottowia thiooxydans]|uniref:PepSY-associated TM helix domain-containing protein n=1 Tax=Ottowia thiooxydans TaxID=219182 RepID=UPI0003F9DE56|nr:PepSY-associated TM helix domain-containing protein [Ottowia thiooxydans]
MSQLRLNPGTEPDPRGIRQTMSDLHIWTGLLAGWILYAMFLTGTVSYFKDEISHYMRPELPAAAANVDPGETAQRIADAILARSPGTTQFSVNLPTDRNPAATALWRDGKSGRRGFGNGVFDPATGEKLDARDTRGGDFFYTFHFNLHYMSPLWGRWIAGFCAMFMLVAIVSGVITHKKIFIDFFTFRGGKGQRSWLDAHTALSVFGLPFHFMITWSGLITLMVLYMPWGLQTLKTPERQAVTSEMRFFLPPGKPAGQEAALKPLAAFVRQGEQRWGAGGVGAVQVSNAGDAQARIVVVRQQAQRVSTTPHYLLFDGVSGKLLTAKDSSGAAASTQGVLYGLHLARFADPVMRWLYFLVSLAGTAMVGTGLVLWTVKRRVKLPNPDRPYFGFWLVERLNICAIAGLSIAMAGMLWVNRLMPLEIRQRGDWEIHGFFIIWGLTLIWALARPAKRAWIELLWAGTATLALLPIVNLLTTDRPIWRSVAEGDWVFAGLEMTLLALAAVHAVLAVRTARHKPKTKPVRKSTVLVGEAA